MRRTLSILAGLLVALAVAVVGQGAAPIMIYYLDPGSALTPAQLEGKIGPLLEKLNPGTQFKAFARVHELQAAIAKNPPDFLLIPPYLRKPVVGADMKLTPLLIRERDHSSFYELVMVGPGGKVDAVRGKTIAASGDAAQFNFLDEVLLKESGMRAGKDYRVLALGKDIDCVMAAGTGQAAAACAPPGSVDLVKKANPSVAPNVKEILRVSDIPLAALYSYGAQDGAKVSAVQRLFGGLHESEDGKKILKLFKADRLVAVDGPIREKLEKAGGG